MSPNVTHKLKTWGLFGVPSEALFVEINNQLGALLSGELRWNQHCFVAVLPLNQESQLSANVSCSDDLVRLQPAVERILVFAVLLLSIFRILLELLIRMLRVVVMVCFLASRHRLFLFFRSLRFILRGVWFRLALFGAIFRSLIALLGGAHGCTFIWTVANTSLLPGTGLRLLSLKEGGGVNYWEESGFESFVKIFMTGLRDWKFWGIPECGSLAGASTRTRIIWTNTGAGCESIAPKKEATVIRAESNRRLLSQRAPCWSTRKL